MPVRQPDLRHRRPPLPALRPVSRQSENPGDKQPLISSCLSRRFSGCLARGARGGGRETSASDLRFFYASRGRVQLDLNASGQ